MTVATRNGGDGDDGDGDGGDYLSPAPRAKASAFPQVIRISYAVARARTRRRPRRGDAAQNPHLGDTLLYFTNRARNVRVQDVKFLSKRNIRA